MTSRSEIPIWLGFHNISGILHQDLVLHEIFRDIIDNDILIFFEHKFREIVNDAFDNIPHDWPGKKYINFLVLRAHGLFIYAATVCWFIMEGSKHYSVN